MHFFDNFRHVKVVSEEAYLRYTLQLGTTQKWSGFCSPTRHLRQILQLHTTRFDFSIKSDYLEFQSCQEMHNTEGYFRLVRRWLTSNSQLPVADGCHQIINCFIPTLKSSIINNSSAQFVVSWNYFSYSRSTLCCSLDVNKVSNKFSIKSILFFLICSNIPVSHEQNVLILELKAIRNC